MDRYLPFHWLILHRCTLTACIVGLQLCQVENLNSWPEIVSPRFSPLSLYVCDRLGDILGRGSRSLFNKKTIARIANPQFLVL